MQCLMFKGPWAVNGIILQLAPWQPYFEPAFTKLSTAAVWIQLHNLPVEFWEGESLETVCSLFGKLLKIDDLTSSLSRSRFARICVEIDLAKPLKQGFWIGDDEHRVFVVVLYERLPTFCYKCGIVGHGTNNCSHQSLGNSEPTSPPHCTDSRGQQRQGIREGSESLSDGMEAELAPRSEIPAEEIKGTEELHKTDYGPWMMVTRRRGCGGGRGGTGGSGGQGSHAAHTISRDLSSLHPNDSNSIPIGACETCGTISWRGRGGSSSARVRGSRVADSRMVTSSEKELSTPPELTPDPAVLLESGPERSTPPEACQGLVPKGSVALEPSLRHKGTEPSDKSTLPFTQVSIKGKEITISETLDSTGPLPILRTSKQAFNEREDEGTLGAHQMIVERVSSTLQPSLTVSSEPDQVMSDSDEEDGDSMESEDPMEPEDSMALVQYQSNHRKEALARKISSAQLTSHKKGRVFTEREVS